MKGINKHFKIIAILICALMLLIFLSKINSNSNLSKGDEFSLPELKESKFNYENLIEAYEKEMEEIKASNTNFKDLDFPDQIKKITQREEKKDEPLYNKSNLIKNLENEIASLSQKKSPKKVKKLPLKLTKKKESKNKLQSEKEKIEKRRKILEAFEKNKENEISKNTEISAEIAGDQTITSGKEISFRLMEDIFSDGIKIPRGSYVYGIAHFDKYRVKVVFYNIQLNGKIMPFKRILYDLDGLEGISISGNEIIKDTSEHLTQEAIEVGQDLNREASTKTKIGVSGAKLLKKMVSKNKSEIKVFFDGGHKVILKEIN